MNLSTNKADIVIFANFWHSCPSEPGYLKAVNPKDPRPAPPGNGVIEEKPKPQGHTTVRHGNGSGIKKKGEGKRNGWIAGHLPLYALSLIFQYRSYIRTFAKGIGDHIDLGGGLSRGVPVSDSD